jgi:hypothetical protein
MSKALRESKAAKLAEAALAEAKMNQRLAEAEHEARVEAAVEEAKQRGLEFAILKTRVWRAELVAPGQKLARLLNEWEAMGWQLVNTMPPMGPLGQVLVISARVIEQPIELPAEEEEVEEKTGENAPKDVATDEGEQKREEWAKEHQACDGLVTDPIEEVESDEHGPFPDSGGAVEGEDHAAE